MAAIAPAAKPNGDDMIAILNKGEPEEITIKGYRCTKANLIRSWILYVLTLGFLRLLFHWSPKLRADYAYTRCRLSEAEFVLVSDLDHEYFMVPVKQCSSNEMSFHATQEKHREASFRNDKGPLPPRDRISSLTARNDYFCSPDLQADSVSLGQFRIPAERGETFLSVSCYRSFKHKKIRYIWYEDFVTDAQAKLETLSQGHFGRLPALDTDIACDYYLACKPLTKHEAAMRSAVYGPNRIHVKLKPIWLLLLLEVLNNPFYLFQVFSLCVWFAEYYIYYAIVIIIMTILSVATAIYQSRKNARALKETVGSSSTVELLRPLSSQPARSQQNRTPPINSDDYSAEVVCSTVLVPGDVIRIPSKGCVMDCDAVLVSGNCIVNESMLTGESVPVTKTPIPSSPYGSIAFYHHKEHAKHTLFCGTKVLLVRPHGHAPITVVVLRTGFDTSKGVKKWLKNAVARGCFLKARFCVHLGQLVRSIMYPKPVDFRFVSDMLKFVGILFVIAGLGFLYTIILMSQRGNTAGKMILRACDIITIVVPPALPAALTIGIIAARSRLKKAGIFCISPSAINTSGAADVVCFDKTGTLTEDGLDLACVVPCRGANFEPEINDFTSLPDEPAVQCLAVCHSLTVIDGVLTGDPLDLILFGATGFSYSESTDSSLPIVRSPPVRMLSNVGQRKSSAVNSETALLDTFKPFELQLLHQYPFSSNLQRMSVIVQSNTGGTILYAKGSPEIIASLSQAQSVPGDLNSVLAKFTSKGYRVLAIAWRQLSVDASLAHTLQRETAEKELLFLGLVVLENRLKPETRPAIERLVAANIRPIMITGDNIQTAISVARNCGVISRSRNIYILEISEANVNSEAAQSDGLTQNHGADSLTQSTYKLSLNEVAYRWLPQQSLSYDDSVHFVDSEFDAEEALAPLTQCDFDLPYALAVSGPTYAILRREFPHLLPKLAASVSVWARTSPEQKALIVNDLQAIDYIVCMCGDGANDCGALKAAHSGISLSEAEASIASPFTSKNANIGCVVTLIREGRAALVTTFGIFKYMALYSLTQFFAVCILYWIFTNFADFQFLYQDFLLTTTYAACFGYTAAANELSRQRPPVRLLSIASFASIASQLGVVAFFQLLIYFVIAEEPWFIVMADPGDDNNYNAYQGSAVFLQSMFQYSILAVVYSKAHPFRKTILNNWRLSLALLITVIISTILIIYPWEPFRAFLEIKPPPFYGFRGLILLLGACNVVIAILAEKVLVDWLIFGVLTRRGIYREDKVPKYQQLMAEISLDANWVSEQSKSVVRAHDAAAGRENESFANDPETASNGRHQASTRNDRRGATNEAYEIDHL